MLHGIGGRASTEFRVVLVEPEHGGNVGSIARLMMNFGLSKLWMVNPQFSLGNDAYSLAVHAAEVLEEAVIVDTLDEALSGVQWVVGTTSVVAKNASNLRRTAITLKELAEQANERTEKAALLFGREGNGLSNLELERCDIVVSIPSSPKYRSLNVASAASIVFYELWRAGDDVCERGYVKGAGVEAREKLLEWFDTLAQKGRVAEHRRRLACRAFKNLVSRTFISEREVYLIMGVFRRSITS